MRYIHHCGSGGTGNAIPALAFGHKKANWNAMHGSNKLDYPIHHDDDDDASD